MGPDLVVLPAPGLDEDLGLGQGGEDLRVETRVAERAGAGFHIPVLPGTARCDDARGPAEPLRPGAPRSRGARRAVVGAEGGRRAALDEELSQPRQDIVAAQPAGHVETHDLAIVWACPAALAAGWWASED